MESTEQGIWGGNTGRSCSMSDIYVPRSFQLVGEHKVLCFLFMTIVSVIDDVNKFTKFWLASIQSRP